LPEPAMAEVNSGLGTFSIHSDRFNSLPGIEPVTDTRAFSGGEVFKSVSTSPRAKANGRMMLPAARMADAKPGSAPGSGPLKRMSKRISLGWPGAIYLTNSVQIRRVQGQRWFSAA